MSKKEKFSKPNYHQITITCACGSSFESGSTLEEVRVDICSTCHPFFTGSTQNKKVQGQIEKFNKKYNLS